MTDKVVAIYVDADACPVKDEVYKVAERYRVKVYVVANAPILVPRVAAIERVLVAEGPDVADDWIAERVAPGSVVVTADIPLAARCVRAGAATIAPNGRPFNRAVNRRPACDSQPHGFAALERRDHGRPPDLSPRATVPPSCRRSTSPLPASSARASSGRRIGPRARERTRPGQPLGGFAAVSSASMWRRAA